MGLHSEYSCLGLIPSCALTEDPFKRDVVLMPWWYHLILSKVRTGNPLIRKWEGELSNCLLASWQRHTYHFGSLLTHLNNMRAVPLRFNTGWGSVNQLFWFTLPQPVLFWFHTVLGSHCLLAGFNCGSTAVNQLGSTAVNQLLAKSFSPCNFLTRWQCSSEI